MSIQLSRTRAFIFVWNNYPSTYAGTLDRLKARYLLYGKEVGPECGTPHLQGKIKLFIVGYVYFEHAKSVGAVRRKLPGVHVEPAKGNILQNQVYCKKGGDYVESGDPPIDNLQRGNNEITRWDLARAAAQEGRFEDIPSDIFIRQYSALRRIHRDYMPSVVPNESLSSLWIHGKSGCGKSRSCYRAFPDAYWKPRNQWWDGYQSEPVVVLDDVDKFDVRLGGFLKHWADYYPFIAETKGGSQRIRPNKIVVTSQYTIEEIWLDAETRDALNRRFIVIEKLIDQEILLI